MTETASPGAPWFLVPRRIERPRLRLFCLPHAGASATMFHRWPGALPADVEVIGVQLPGRSYRLSEAPFTRMADLVQALETAIAPYLDGAFALFGHSMGALVAFELARALQRSGSKPPRRLILCGRAGPQLHRPSDVHRLPEDAFRETLHRRYDMPREQLDNAALMALALPALRADFQVIETWRYVEGSLLHVPLTAATGTSDTTVDPSGLSAWAAVTTGPVETLRFDGGHHFLVENPGAWLEALAVILRL